MLNQRPSVEWHVLEGAGACLWTRQGLQCNRSSHCATLSSALPTKGEERLYSCLQQLFLATSGLHCRKTRRERETPPPKSRNEDAVLCLARFPHVGLRPTKAGGLPRLLFAPHQRLPAECCRLRVRRSGLQTHQGPRRDRSCRGTRSCECWSCLAVSGSHQGPLALQDKRGPSKAVWPSWTRRTQHCPPRQSSGPPRPGATNQSRRLGPRRLGVTHHGQPTSVIPQCPDIPRCAMSSPARKKPVRGLREHALQGDLTLKPDW